jgi:hypothetical protein
MTGEGSSAIVSDDCGETVALHERCELVSILNAEGGRDIHEGLPEERRTMSGSTLRLKRVPKEITPIAEINIQAFSFRRVSTSDCASPATFFALRSSLSLPPSSNASWAVEIAT